MVGALVFGFGRRKKQQDTIALVSAVLTPIYEVHFKRTPPANLARVIVDKSFNPEELKFGGRTLATVGIAVHAAEALQAAYSDLGIGEEAQAACAEALGLLLRRALGPDSGSVAAHDREYLAITARSLASDRQWQEAVSRVPGGSPSQPLFVSLID